MLNTSKEVRVGITFLCAKLKSEEVITLTTYVFEDENVLVNHLYKKLANPTRLKVQKSLYLLWAYYAATYGNLEYDEYTEFEEYPDELFKPEFQAWRYGPVDQTVYENQKKDGYYSANLDLYSPETNVERDVSLFMDDLLSEINDINDFGLVELTHQDHSWRDVYKPGELFTEMDSESIKNEYINRFEEKSKI